MSYSPQPLTGSQGCAPNQRLPYQSPRAVVKAHYWPVSKQLTILSIFQFHYLQYSDLFISNPTGLAQHTLCLELSCLWTDRVLGERNQGSAAL